MKTNQTEVGYIMALEDSLVQAKRMEHFLKKNHFAYKIYSSAEEALEEITKSKPILIISDILMPGIDGYQFCKIIKSNPETCDIPVILLTALQDPNDIIRGLQVGADNFITKPYEERNLYSRINHLLTNRQGDTLNSPCKIADPIDINYRGEEFSITSGRKQILDLLISVYDTAVQRNEELTQIKERLESTNKELIQANEDLDAFARTVSHDLKSPLTVILGFSDAILTNEKSMISEEERSYLSFMKESALEMNQLIKDLLSFSQSGRLQLKKEHVDLGEIANDLLRSLLLEYSQIKPQIIIEPSLEAFADPTLMRVALDNLLGNALKYSSKQESPQIIFGKKSNFGKNIFFIQDNGVGFDSDNADKLFQPFARFHSSLEYSGTGVGLSTVKRIIDKHGGEIWAESQPLKGSIFYFTID